MTRADPVAEYTAVLDAALQGPRRAKERMLAEIGEGLLDAAEPYRSAGLDLATAVDRAVDEFGRPHDLVPDCQRELTIRQTRSTAGAVAVAVPVLVAGWHLLWVGGGHGGWRLAAIALAAVTGLAAAQAVVALVLTGRRGRAVRTPPRLPAVTAWTASVAAVTMLLATAALAASVGDVALLPALVLAAVVGHVAVAGSAHTCRRCWARTRPPGTDRGVR